MSELNTSAAGKHRGCPHCGHLLRYDMESRKLKCTACDQYTELSYYDPTPEEAQSGTMNVVEYCCPQCGAAVHTTDTNLISYCNHCGSEVLFTERMTTTRKPDWIVPFQISREECEAIYRKRMKKAVFASNDARQAAEAKDFQPMYVPFFLYECQFNGKADLIYKKTDGVYVETYRQEMDCDVKVGWEPQCASSQMDPVLAEQLSISVKTKELFSPAYLCGFYAEASDMKAKETDTGHLDEYMKHQLHDCAKKANIIGALRPGTYVEMPKETQQQTQMILLPVWLLGQKQGGRVLYTAIDGADGSIVCETPIQHSKVYLLGAALGVLLAAILLLLSSAVILRAQLVAGLCALLLAACRYVVEGTLIKRKLQTDSMAFRQKKRNSERLSKEAVLEIAYHRKLYNEKPSKKQNYTLWEWCMVYLPLILFFTFVVGSFCSRSSENNNQFIAGMVGDKGWLAPCLCIMSALSTIIPKLNNHEGWSPSTFSLLLSIGLIGLGVVMLFFSAQWFYYGAAMAQIALMIFMTACLTNKHNEFVTRPVPYFGKGKEAER